MLLDARPLHVVLAYGVFRRYPVLSSRDHAHRIERPVCVCPDLPHPFCKTVTCCCDHGIGAQ